MPDLAPPIPLLNLFRQEFRAAYGPSISFHEIDNRWEELSEGQQAEYTHRAQAVNQPAQDEFVGMLGEGYRVQYPWGVSG
jgi:hypothetical protein